VVGLVGGGLGTLLGPEGAASFSGVFLHGRLLLVVLMGLVLVAGLVGGAGGGWVLGLPCVVNCLCLWVGCGWALRVWVVLPVA
jgi:hypothetical protein